MCGAQPSFPVLFHSLVRKEAQGQRGIP